FSREAAIGYLMSRSRRDDREAAGRLAEALDRLPLALSHARAYCRDSNLAFDDYTRLLPELIRRAPTTSRKAPSVYASFDLALTKAAEACPDAERLMGLLAFLAPQQIPLWLFADRFTQIALSDAVAALARLSLLSHEALDDGAPAVAVHRLVQEVMRGRLQQA